MTVGKVTGMEGTDVEGPLPPGKKGGMAVTLVAGPEPPLMGSEPSAVCVVTRGPLGLGLVRPVEGIHVMIGGMDVRPLLTIPS